MARTMVHLLQAVFAALICSACGSSINSNNVGHMKLVHRYSSKPGSCKSNNGSGMTEEHLQLLKSHDRGHLIKLRSSVVSLPVSGAADPYVAGLYFTRVELGTPSRFYNLQVDTGSDLLWINCNPCVGCPTFSDLKIPIIPYDVQASSSSSKISCTDPTCGLITQISESGCDERGMCGYSFAYGDGSSTVGYLVEDVFHYLTNASAVVTFGCGFKQSGDLASSERALDGIIGFGTSELSIPSQLSKQGRTPNVFAHCLEGGDTGGGILVLGKVLEPDLVYTPLVPLMGHYNVNLRNISVNGFNLTLDSSIFMNYDTHGTIFDSGTTLAYLPENAYRVFVNAIIDASSAPSLDLNGNTCFIVSKSIYKAFPEVILFFDGAAMHLTPAEYLIRQASAENAPIWCMGWQSTGFGDDQLQFTIIGDLVLKNKLVVYDLDERRIGWCPYDCSASVKVSSDSGDRFISPDHIAAENTAELKSVSYLLAFAVIIVCLLLNL